MPRIKNVSPFGDLDVPLLGQIVEHGSIIEVSDEQAEILLQQESNWLHWGEEAQKAQRRGERKAAAQAKETEPTASVAAVPEGDEAK